MTLKLAGFHLQLLQLPGEEFEDREGRGREEWLLFLVDNDILLLLYIHTKMTVLIQIKEHRNTFDISNFKKYQISKSISVINTNF